MIVKIGLVCTTKPRMPDTGEEVLLNVVLCIVRAGIIHFKG